MIEVKGQIFCFVGAEGAGKTAQADLLAKELGLPLVAFGDIFRFMAKNDLTKLGDECRSILLNHNYIKPDMLYEIIGTYIKQDQFKKGFVIDGAFRTLAETENFESMLNAADRNMPLTVFFLRIPGWQSFQRLTHGRRREDDTEEGVLSRLGNFYSELGKRVSFIRKRWNFIMVVERNKSIGEIHQNIMGGLGKI